MVYVAWLRGINVGGNRTVSMAALKQTFERLALGNVRTFINSGNVVFSTRTADSARLVKRIETAIEEDFKMPIKVMLRDLDEMTTTVDGLPKNWANNTEMKCDVMFLSHEIDEPEIVKELPITAGIDTVRYTPGAVIWRIDRDKVTKSKVTKIVGTATYKRMTVRNCNTVRKVYALMQGVEDS